MQQFHDDRGRRLVVDRVVRTAVDGGVIEERRAAANLHDAPSVVRSGEPSDAAVKSPGVVAA